MEVCSQMQVSVQAPVPLPASAMLWTMLSTGQNG